MVRDGRGVQLNELYNPALIKNAKTLRKAMTKEERKLWYTFLRYLPIKFVKQKVLGHYIADFYCAEKKLVIELDGAQHYEAGHEEHDAERTKFMEQYGMQVVRFTNDEVLRDFEHVKEVILYYLDLE